MKIASEIKLLVEADEQKTLSDVELKKFWKAMQDHVFKESKDVKENDLGLFLDGIEIEFNAIRLNDSGSPEGKFSPAHDINDIKLTALGAKDIVSEILNAHVLSEESTEEQDEQAFQYLLKHLKGETVYIYGEAEAEGISSKGNYNLELSYEGTVKIKNIKYDANKDAIICNDPEIVKMKVDQQ